MHNKKKLYFQWDCESTNSYSNIPPTSLTKFSIKARDELRTFNPIEHNTIHQSQTIHSRLQLKNNTWEIVLNTIYKCIERMFIIKLYNVKVIIIIIITIIKLWRQQQQQQQQTKIKCIFLRFYFRSFAAIFAWPSFHVWDSLIPFSPVELL